MPADQAMLAEVAFSGSARRIGISGPPGAGKSSLIARLAQRWLGDGERVGVLAIDPTSPLTGGALLGDRVRMDAIADSANLYIRSLSSRSSGDGLCPNICLLLDAVQQQDFDTIVVETVGVGQVSHQARALVDTFVVVLVPDSGDTVQAMKAGIMEVADIYVVNKCELASSQKLAAELRSMARWRSQREHRVPPVILASAAENRGIDELAEAISDHRATMLTPAREAELASARRDYHLRALLGQHVDDIIDRNQSNFGDAPLSDCFATIVGQLQTSLRSAMQAAG